MAAKIICLLVVGAKREADAIFKMVGGQWQRKYQLVSCKHVQEQWLLILDEAAAASVISFWAVLKLRLRHQLAILFFINVLPNKSIA